MKKTLFKRVVAVCLWFALTTSFQAQIGTPEFDPLGEYDDLPKQIRVQVEFIDVPHEQFTELMFGPKPPADDVELRKQAGQLVKEGKATILETMLCVARSGQRATSESVEEFIYPTEYEPAELPDNTPAKEKEATEKPKTNRCDFAIGPIPTAFESRDIGSTLEIEPTLSENNKIIDLRFKPEIIYHVGNEIWAEWKSEYGNTPVQMPKFYVVRFNTDVVLVDGQSMLVAALSPKNKDGFPDFTRKLMVFVRADVITVGR